MLPVLRPPLRPANPQSLHGSRFIIIDAGKPDSVPGDVFVVRFPAARRIQIAARNCRLREEMPPGPAMKLVGPLAARSPGLRLALALQIERHCSADEVLQGRLINLLAFVDVYGAPDIPVEAGVE